MDIRQSKTLSKLEPIDQVVIRSLKAYYKSLGLQRLVAAINKGKNFQFFDFRPNENSWFVMVQSETLYYRQLFSEDRNFETTLPRSSKLNRKS